MGIFTFIVITVLLLGILMAGIHFKKKPLIYTAAAGILVMCFVGCKLISGWQAQRIKDLEKLISHLKEETVPMEFKVIKDSKGEKEIQVRFFDLDNKEAGISDTISIEGDDLYFEFLTIRLDDDNWMYFPERIYSNRIAPDQGISLLKYYDKNNYPEIYSNFEKFIDENEINSKLVNEYREKIQFVFEKVKAHDYENIAEMFGNTVHDLRKQDILSFKKGFTYQVICHTHTGSLEVKKK